MRVDTITDIDAELRRIAQRKTAAVDTLIRALVTLDACTAEADSLFNKRCELVAVD